MKKLIIEVSDSFVKREVEIKLSEKDYKKLMSIYDDECGLDFVIKEAK